jgi:hypothetical protein
MGHGVNGTVGGKIVNISFKSIKKSPNMEIDSFYFGKKFSAFWFKIKVL